MVVIMILKVLIIYLEYDYNSELSSDCHHLYNNRLNYESPYLTRMQIMLC